MPIKFVDEKTGEFIPEALKETGTPSRYGINTPEGLVEMSIHQASTTKSDDVFFRSVKVAKVTKKAITKKPAAKKAVAKKAGAKKAVAPKKVSKKSK